MDRDPTPNDPDYGWAWAAVRFGFTPDEWAALTPAQIALLSKADEMREVAVAEAISSAVSTAICNAFRKKGQKAKKVYRKRKKRGAAKGNGRDMARKMREIQEKQANRG